MFSKLFCLKIKKIVESVLRLHFDSAQCDVEGFRLTNNGYNNFKWKDYFGHSSLVMTVHNTSFGSLPSGRALTFLFDAP
jgi:hypothetical protein